MLLHKYDRWTFVRPIEFYLNTYRPIYANAFTFFGVGLCVVVWRSLDFLRRWNVYCISAYKILLCICDESDFTKIAILINFHNALLYMERRPVHRLIIYNFPFKLNKVHWLESHNVDTCWQLWVATSWRRLGPQRPPVTCYFKGSCGIFQGRRCYSATVAGRQSHASRRLRHVIEAYWNLSRLVVNPSCLHSASATQNISFRTHRKYYDKYMIR